METNILYFRLLVLLSAVSLCGCSNDDEPVATATDGTTLTVTARADGFASTDGTAHTGTPQTRASESGYTTTFVKGDQIGVFAVKDGSVITGCQNVPCTYDGTNWSGTVYKCPGATYFAYYPYSADMNNKTSVDEIVTAFNATVTAATDQSTYAKYTACDLMTTDVVSPKGSSLSFSFTHKMSLIEISLPVQKYKTTSNANAYEYSAPVLGATFSLTPSGSSATTIKPCPMGNGAFRYIVPAGTSGATVSGAFNTADGKTIEYSKSSLSLSAGNYKRLNVTYSGAPSTTVRALAAGDFYYSDGSIYPGDASNPPSEDCIGIVMKVGKDESSDWKDDCQYKKKDGSTTMSAINGYVLALYDANGGSTCEWGSYGIQVDHTDMNRERNTGFYGYKNTQAIISFNKSKSGTLSSAFPATYYATVGYEASYPAPANSSGWFLPSAGQCKYWLNNKETLLASVRKATGDSGYNWNDWYWSSSEYSSIPADGAWYAYFDDSYVDVGSKGYNFYVRSCLAF